MSDSQINTEAIQERNRRGTEKEIIDRGSSIQLDRTDL